MLSLLTRLSLKVIPCTNLNRGNRAVFDENLELNPMLEKIFKDEGNGSLGNQTIPGNKLSMIGMGNGATGTFRPICEQQVDSHFNRIFSTETFICRPAADRRGR
jgi:hypothetical protein